MNWWLKNGLAKQSQTLHRISCLIWRSSPKTDSVSFREFALLNKHRIIPQKHNSEINANHLLIPSPQAMSKNSNLRLRWAQNQIFLKATCNSKSEILSPCRFQMSLYIIAQSQGKLFFLDLRLGPSTFRTTFFSNSAKKELKNAANFCWVTLICHRLTSHLPPFSEVS